MVQEPCMLFAVLSPTDSHTHTEVDGWSCVFLLRPWRKPWRRMTRSFVSSLMVFLAMLTTLRAGTGRWMARRTSSLCFSLTAAMRCVVQTKRHAAWQLSALFSAVFVICTAFTGLRSEVFRQGEGQWANRRQQRKLGKKVESNSQNPLCSCRIFRQCIILNRQTL